MTEKQNRTIHYSFKATPEEDAIIQRKMKTFGITNQSAFIRAMALNGYVLKLDLPEQQCQSNRQTVKRTRFHL